MSDVLQTLKQGMSCLRTVEHELEADKNIGLSADILRAILALDMRYQEFCARFDEDDGEPKGSLYKDPHGISIEFYIEAEDWRKISLAFRNWISTHPNWREELNVEIPEGFEYD